MRRSPIDSGHTTRPSARLLPVLLAALLAISAMAIGSAAPPSVQAADSYENPLLPEISGDGVVESCADPSTIRADDGFWYTYCTTDPLNGEDRSEGGGFNFRKIPTLRSADLVTWTYVGDAFTAVPDWGAPTAGMWAPEIEIIDGTYYLFYGITDVRDEVSGEPGCGGDNAIGYATSDSPTGPWVDSGGPLVEPRRAGPGCNFFWTFDPRGR